MKTEILIRICPMCGEKHEYNVNKFSEGLNLFRCPVTFTRFEVLLEKNKDYKNE